MGIFPELEALLEKRISLAQLPTPVQNLEELSEELQVNLFVKRDDLTESVASGNKIRKLEYLLYHARQNGCDMLITCGGIQSNHCRATAAVAARLGMRCHLILRGEPPRIPVGNLLIDEILGATCSFYSRDDFKHLHDIEEETVAAFKAEGYSPYLIPMGGSNATGSLGYVRMVGELQEVDPAMDVMFCALGSGGTYAGIMIGLRHYQIPWSLHGIAVCDDAAYFEKEVARILKEFSRWYDVDLPADLLDTNFDDRFVGRGYGLNTLEELEELVRIARLEGMILDPVYTLKTFLGMVGQIKEGKIHKGANVLFIHTGGHYGIFPKGEEFLPLLDDRHSGRAKGSSGKGSPQGRAS
ncbi:MAG: D-cysteine desulfhydrase family protein [Deltaproteobacteria bacterium]|nr:D-cysteine desulfhydrase family protein [Deltaproteobacteria bacterium]MBW2071486.1 D-cysteine desulfhydrase family protein [Deltaproteobacteria bacterium]